MLKHPDIPSDEILVKMSQSKLRGMVMTAMNQRLKAAKEDRWSAHQRWGELLQKCQQLINEKY